MDLSVTEAINAIEGPQVPNRQGHDSLTLSEIMDRYKVPGLSVVVIKDFAIHWAKGYGIADVVTGNPVNADTLFQAGSVSKPVAAMAVMRAVQDGKFSLDDDINTVLKSWKLPESPFLKDRTVTPRMLVSHTAGLGDSYGFPGYDPSDKIPSVVQILNGGKPSNLGPVLFARPPMTAAQYSGGGVTIMQLALTDALGMPFPDILQKHVFDPIGMANSTYEHPLPPERDENACRAHDGQGRAMGAKYHLYPEFAAAGLWSTPTDLAKLLIEVQKSVWGRSNRVLSQAMTNEMLNPVGLGDHALGFQISKQGQGWYFGHGGDTLGFVCLVAAHKVKGYGFVVMTNAESGMRVINEVKERIERAYNYDSLHKPVLRRPWQT